jgi:hypothetical protein
MPSAVASSVAFDEGERAPRRLGVLGEGRVAALELRAVTAVVPCAAPEHVRRARGEDELRDGEPAARDERRGARAGQEQRPADERQREQQVRGDDARHPAVIAQGQARERGAPGDRGRREGSGRSERAGGLHAGSGGRARSESRPPRPDT